MLAIATELIAEKGSEAVRMNEIADLAGVSIGSLYQYFPDKTAIVRTLAERYNAQGRACVEAELAPVSTEAELESALARIVDAYYAMFLTEPAMRDIWWATQGDKTLQALDAEDGAAHTTLLESVLIRLRPTQDRQDLTTRAILTMHLLATTVRLAISLEPAQGEALVAAFKGSLRSLVASP